MKRRYGYSLAVGLLTAAISSAEPAMPLATGLARPLAATAGPDGRVYVSLASDPNGGDTARVVALTDGKLTPFATGFREPLGLAGHGKYLYVADVDRIWRIDGEGRAEVFVAASAFPAPVRLGGLVADFHFGNLYAFDPAGTVFTVSPKGVVKTVADRDNCPGLKSIAALAIDNHSHLLIADREAGRVVRLRTGDRAIETVADDLGRPDGLSWDYFGRLWIGDSTAGRLFAIPRPGQRPIAVADVGPFTSWTIDGVNDRLLIVDARAGTLQSRSIAIPGWEVDTTPLALAPAPAFPNLKWTDWQAESDSGKPIAHRPIVLTHAGDGSHRIFVATQHGVIHMFAGEPDPTRTEVFLDLQDRVVYDDRQNEEGFLGMAFHPRFRDTGEFFVFYTPKAMKSTNVVSRFKVRPDDPNRGDPASEEILLKFPKPYWNHDGGTICFGPDGYLYVTHGDGGSANDPHDNGQNLRSMLGKILRIDISRREGGRPYAIPADNPFVGRPDARPEIWAYGLRNVWRMAFDRATGRLWAADVGQNLYEEINLIERGGNYGWNRREGLHPFGAKGVDVCPDLIDPVWEYHHDLGKSITGGHVYRGSRRPELRGAYLYADYVSGRIWALWYDESKGRVVANRPLRDHGMPVFSFGEDEAGEIYLLTATASGRGLYTLEPVR